MKYSKHGYKKNSKDRNNPYNIIPSGEITMKGVDFPVYGVDDLGNEQIMMPGANYIFPGNEVFEIPLVQDNGGDFDPEMIFKNKYNTKLTKKEQKEFEKWIVKESKRQDRDIMFDAGAYDIQGFWKSGDYKKMDKDNHGSDRWKKPNHPTFSDQSVYHGVDGYDGGTWQDDGGYTPAKHTRGWYTEKYYRKMFGREPHRPEYLLMPKKQQGGEESNMHPFEQWATSQGMNPQEALQMISANPKSYPSEVIEAAQSYAQELQRQNPINDKQDERIYEAKQEQSLYQEGNEVAADPGGPVIEEPEMYTLGTDELGNIPGEYYNSTGEFKKQPWLNRQGFREELKGPEYPFSFNNEEGYNEWDKEGMSEEDYFIKQDRDRITQFIVDNENIFTKPEVDAWHEEDRNWYVDAYKEDMPLNDFESSYPPMASGALTYDPLAFMPFPAGAVTSGIAKPVVGFLDDVVRGVRNTVPNFFNKTPLKKHADEVAEWMKKYYSHPKHKYQSHIHNEQVRRVRQINDRTSGASFAEGLPQSSYDMMREITPMPNLNQRISMRMPYDRMINPNISYKEMYKGVTPGQSIGMRDQAISNFKKHANISGDMMGNSAVYNKSYRNLLQDLTSDLGLRKGLGRFYDNFLTSSGISYPKGLSHLPKTSGNIYTQSRMGPFRVKRRPKDIKSTMVHEGDHFYMNNGLRMPTQQRYALADLSKRNTYQGSPVEKLYKKLFGKNTKSFTTEKDYYQDINEINARVMQMRYEMGIMPGKKLSKPALEMYMKKNPDLHGMKKWLNVDKSGKFNKDDLLNYFNNFYQPGGETDYTPQTQEEIKLDDVKDGEVNTEGLTPYVNYNIPYDVDFHETDVPDYIKLRQSIAESTLDPSAVSEAGATGLTQIMPITLKHYEERTGDTTLDVTNYQDAMKVQDWLMNDLYNADWINKPNQSEMVRMAKTLSAYNWGRTRFNEFINKQKDNKVDIYSDKMPWIKDLPPETENYLSKILWDNHPQMTIDYKHVMDRPEKYGVYFDAYNFDYKKGGERKKQQRLWKEYKKYSKGENISPVVIKELEDLGLIKSHQIQPNKYYKGKKDNQFSYIDDGGEITFADQYMLEDLDLAKVSRGAESPITLKQQVGFYQDHINSIYDGTKNFKKSKALFDKINRLYLLDSKKDKKHVLSYMKSLPEFQDTGETTENNTITKSDLSPINTAPIDNTNVNTIPLNINKDIYNEYTVPTNEEVNNEVLFPTVENSTEENPIYNDGRNLGAIVYYTPRSERETFFTSDSERMTPYLDETYGAGNYKVLELPHQAYQPRYTYLSDAMNNHPAMLEFRESQDAIRGTYDPRFDAINEELNALSEQMGNEDNKDSENFKRLNNLYLSKVDSIFDLEDIYSKERRDHRDNFYDNLETTHPDLFEIRNEYHDNYTGDNKMNKYVSAKNIADQYFGDIKNLRSDGKIFFMQHSDSRIGPLTLTESQRDDNRQTPGVVDTFGEILLPESEGGWLADNNQVVCYAGMCGGVEEMKELTEASGVTTIGQPGRWSGYQGPNVFPGDNIESQFFNTNQEGLINPDFDGGTYITHALNDGILESDSIGDFSRNFQRPSRVIDEQQAFGTLPPQAAASRTSRRRDLVQSDPLGFGNNTRFDGSNNPDNPQGSRTSSNRARRFQRGGFLKKLFTKSSDDLALKTSAKQTGKGFNNLIDPINPAGSDVFGSPYMFEEPMNMPFNYTESANNALNTISEMLDPIREAKVIKQNTKKLNPFLETLSNATGRATSKAPLKGAKATKEQLFKLADEARLFEPRRINWRQEQIDKYWYFDQASEQMKLRKTGYNRTTNPGRKDWGSDRPGKNQTFPNWLRDIDAQYQKGLSKGQYQDVIGHDVNAIDRFAWSLKSLGHDITGAEFKKMFPQKIYHGSPNTFDHPIIDWSNPDMRPPGMSLDEFNKLKKTRNFKNNPPTFMGTLDPTYSVGYSASGPNNWSGNKSLAQLAEQETGVLADDVSSLSGHQTYTYTIPDNANVRYTTSTLTGGNYRNADGSLTKAGQKLVDEGVDVIWGRNAMGGSELLHLTQNSVENFSAVPKLDRSKLHQPGYFQDADIADMPQLQYEIETGRGNKSEHPWNLFNQRHIEHPNLMGGPAITVPYQSPFGGSPSLDITKMNPEDFLMRGDQHFMKGRFDDGPGIEYNTPYTTPYFDEGGSLPKVNNTRVDNTEVRYPMAYNDYGFLPGVYTNYPYQYAIPYHLGNEAANLSENEIATISNDAAITALEMQDEKIAARKNIINPKADGTRHRSIGEKLIYNPIWQFIKTGAKLSPYVFVGDQFRQILYPEKYEDRPESILSPFWMHKTFGTDPYGITGTPQLQEIKEGKELPKAQMGFGSLLRNIVRGSKKKFLSEIDWVKWNKAIPEDKALMEEYHAIEEMTKRNGTWMKNPDGSDFVGLPEQFVQQQSDNFKASFGESKLLNPDGSPMIVYHGSAKKFDQFDPKRFTEGDAGYSGVGIYTTPNKTTASSYAHSSRTNTDKFIPTIYELYGNTINPISSSRLIDNVGGDIYPFGTSLTDAHKIDKSLPLDLFNFNRTKGRIGTEFPIHFDAAIKDQQRGIADKRTMQDAWEIVFPNVTQVKSSTGNVGTFDLTNPNIYKQYGGGLRNPLLASVD